MTWSRTGARHCPPRRERLVLTVVLCALVAMLDGFDTQSIAFVAPSMARAWAVPVSKFGPVFGAGLLGLTIGSLVLGPVADFVGRRPIIIISTLAFGFGSLLTAWVDGINSLLVLRFATGLGLGAAMPNIIALTCEHAPPPLRARVITIMFAGIPFGAALGGFASAQLIAHFGWPSVFLVGGLAPLVLAIILMSRLPESPAFLADRASRSPGRAHLLRSIDTLRGVGALFTEGRAAATVLLWIAFFANLLVMYFLINWLPTLVRDAGLSVQAAVNSTATLTMGGVAGGFTLGVLIDRFGPVRIIAGACAAATLCIAAMAYSTHDIPILFAAVFLTGFGIIGSQIGMNVIAAATYPTAIRATGASWSLGIGRIGSIVGPVVGGVFLQLQWSSSDMLLIACVPALVASVAILILGTVPRSATVDEADLSLSV